MAQGHTKEEHVARVVEEQQKHPPEKPISSPSSTPGSHSDDGRGGGGGGGGFRNVGAAILALLFLVGLTILIVWLVYRPHKPRFSVAGASIYDLNFTAATLISTSVQFSVLARNPNRRVSAHYDRLSMYVTYRDQMITPPLTLPPLRLPKKTTVVIAPVMGGTAVPVSPEIANGLKMDETYGVVLMRVVIQGRVRWKAGGIKSGRYGLYVKCDAWLRFKKGSSGQVPLLAPSTCKVDV